MFVVKNVNEFSLADHTRRIITLQEKESPQNKRNVHQFHFTSWPDKGVPDMPVNMASFVRSFTEFHLKQPNQEQPVVGEFYDQADAKWIVTRELLSSHNDMLCRWPTPGRPISILGVGHLKVYLILLIPIN
jgi:hypothetical protein